MDRFHIKVSQWHCHKDVICPSLFDENAAKCNMLWDITDCFIKQTQTVDENSLASIWGFKIVVLFFYFQYRSISSGPFLEDVVTTSSSARSGARPRLVGHSLLRLLMKMSWSAVSVDKYREWCPTKQIQNYIGGKFVCRYCQVEVHCPIPMVVVGTKQM